MGNLIELFFILLLRMNFIIINRIMRKGECLMTRKEKLKNMIDQLPDEKINLIEPLVQGLLQKKKVPFPKGKLGIKRPFKRENLYDDILANRY